MTNSADNGDTAGAAVSREELTDAVDTYLDAVVAGDPDAAPIAPDGAFVENVERKKPGEGLWETASATPEDFAIYVPDPVSGQVGFLGLMEEDGDPILLGLRLELGDEGITEMEHLIARDLGDGPGEGDLEGVLEHFEEPRPAFQERVSPEERNSRDEMLEIAESYYDALEEDDGSLAPFADDAVRFENGMQMTHNEPPAEPGRGTIQSLDTAEQLDTQVMSYIDRIENRRVEIADVERGLVCGLSHFRHPMEETTLEIEGVPGLETVEMDYGPFDLPALHIYKVYDGQIHEIEAMGFLTSYNAPTGWE